MTPQPPLSAGLLVNYGSQQLVEDQAWYRGYDLSVYRRRCGIAAMSPVHLGRVAWVRVDGGTWFGPCGVVDTVAQGHFNRAVFSLGEVAEIPRWLAERLGFKNGAQGQVFFGRCPPTGDWPASRYRPPLRLSQPGETRPSFWPHAPQQMPGPCSRSAIN